MTYTAKQTNTEEKFPSVTKELLTYMKSKVSGLKYSHGDSIKPEDVAYIYGQQSMYEVLLSLYNRSMKDGNLLNAKALYATSGEPRGNQEEGISGSIKE